MARRTFTVIDVVEVLQHWHAGRPKSVVASSLGVDAKTVRKYVAKAEAAGMVPGGPPLSQAEWAELVAGWFPELVDARARSVTWPEIDRHRQLIGEMVKTNTVTTVHQRLRDELDLRAGITSVRRYVASEFPAEAARDKVTVLRPPVAPGEEAQIDYGLLGSWLDPVAERVRRVWAFIMVLACSRHMFVRPVLNMDERSWVAAHVAAASFFGGLPRRLVPDNLKTGVTRPDLYDPLVNRAYGEFAAHYGVLIDPARAANPRTSPASSARCRSCGTASGGAGTGRTRPTCKPLPSAGASRWRAGAPTAPSTGPVRWRCSMRSKRAPWWGCRRSRSSWPAGPARRWALTATSGSAGPCIRCRGGSSAPTSTPARPTGWSRCSSTGPW